jgi:hypothetical protein
MYSHLFKSLPASSAAFASVLAGAVAASKSERSDANETVVSAGGWSKLTQCHHKSKDVVGMLHDLDERVSFLYNDGVAFCFLFKYRNQLLILYLKLENIERTLGASSSCSSTAATTSAAPPKNKYHNDSVGKSKTLPGIDVVLGSQWGDEGKGKLVDILSQVRT